MGTYQATIRYNNIYDSKSQYYVSNFWNTQPVTASLNYWGTDSSIVIDQHIYDFFDNPSLGIVTYTPFLSQPDPSAPPSVRNVAFSSPLIGSEVLTVTVDFSTPMDTSIAPNTTFGVISPYTQHSLQNGQWISPHTLGRDLQSRRYYRRWHQHYARCGCTRSRWLFHDFN